MKGLDFVKRFFAATFFNIAPCFYVRNFLFGSCYIIAITYLMYHDKQNLTAHDFNKIGLYITNTILFPYSRLAYIAAIDFLLGSTIIKTNLLAGLLFKIIMMTVCWTASIYMAPLGIIYHYVISKKHQAYLGDST